MRWLRSLPFLVLLAITGCASTQVIQAPAHLLLDCPAPTVEVKVNGDLARAINNYKWALKSCNDDKAALREFHKIESLRD